MVPVPIASRYPHSSRLLYLLLSLGTQYAPRLLHRISGAPDGGLDQPFLVKRESEFDPHDPKSIVFAVLIPVLVLLSGLFAGLTLGYMSLDETQLNVLSISGTPEQKRYAQKIMPVRKNGHLLLVTLLLGNMIVNESLPIIADPILGGGFQSVVVSTVLIVIFAEIIPQSLFTRHGLFLGAKMAGFTKFLIYFLGIISWPVAKLLEFVLGPHHGIIYRRAELKELVAMHDAHGTHGGDLKTDTVAIIGSTLDIQEKVVKQAMTPIEDVFMLSIDSKLDYALLKKICQTGHSRVPVYEEIEVPVSVTNEAGGTVPTQKVKKIIGIFLVKHCVLLDPRDDTPLRDLPLNRVPFVPNNEPLLGVLDKFQEGRSHMAIVSRFSIERAASVKKAVKQGLTQRLRARVGMGDSDSDSEDSDNKDKGILSIVRKRSAKFIKKVKDIEEGTDDGSTLDDSEGKKGDVQDFVEEIAEKSRTKPDTTAKADHTKKNRLSALTGLQLPRITAGMTSMSTLEQSMPADAVLTKEGAADFLQNFDPAVMPLGIITLEDILEELIGEEIYDEFDSKGALGEPKAYEKPERVAKRDSRPSSMVLSRSGNNTPAPRPPTGGTLALPKALGFMRTKSAPPVQRDAEGHITEPGPQVSNAGSTYFSDSPGTPAHFEGGPPLIQMPRPIRTKPSMILERSSVENLPESMQLHAVPEGRRRDRPRTGDSSTIAPLNILSQSIASAFPLTHSVTVPPAMLPGSLSAMAPSSSRSVSPSLEAILLERKRRLMASASASGSGETNYPRPPGMGGYSDAGPASPERPPSQGPQTPAPSRPVSLSGVSFNKDYFAAAAMGGTPRPSPSSHGSASGAGYHGRGRVRDDDGDDDDGTQVQQRYRFNDE